MDGQGEGDGDGDAAAKDASVVCEECCENLAKYRCPGCGLRSCGLPCVQGHKLRTGCTGKRDRTAFVPIAGYDDNLLISDYNFLEEALRVADVAKRTRFNKMLMSSRSELKPAMKALMYQAQGRKTKLSFMAQGMSRRTANTTYYNKKRKGIYWRIEWIFDSTDVRLVDDHVDEHLSLGTVLEKHLSTQRLTAATRHHLRHFMKEPLDQLKLLYKKEPCEVGKEFYYELNLKEALREQLALKSVIEFPVIRVVLASELSRFSILQDPRPVDTKPSTNGVAMNDIGLEEAPKGTMFREEEINDEEDMNLYDFLEDLPGKAAMLWENMDATCLDVEEGEICS